MYNTEFNGNFQAENPNYDLELTRDFERGKGEFHPFWKPDKRVAFRSERAKMSFHTAPGKALIAVSNLTTEPAEYALDFSKLFPDGEFHAVELLSNRPVTSAAVTGKLAPHSCDVIRVDAGKIPAASVPLPPLLGRVVESRDLDGHGGPPLSRSKRRIPPTGKPT